MSTDRTLPIRSVVLASYEGQRYIGAQLDSIVSQLSADDEIIVSDDASTDRTVDLVRERNDPRIKITVNRTRLGYIKNFERAILLARGEYIFLSDQDDVWLPTKVSRMQQALDLKPCAVSDAVIVDDELRQIHPSYFEWRNAGGTSFAAVFLKPRFIGAAMAFKRNYLKTLLPFPRNVPHDFWISLNATWDDSLEIIADPLILYRRHAATASVSAKVLKRSRSIIVAERLLMARYLLSYRLKRLGIRITGGRPFAGT